MNTKVFHSQLSEYIQGFIKEKRATGHKYTKGESTLIRFDDFLINNFSQEKTLSKEIVLSWTQKSEYETVSTHVGRISIMRGLANYMNRLGNSAYVYPPRSVSIKRNSYIPYIFSEKQIAEILRASDNYKSTSSSPYLQYIIPTIMRMLYGCGLRISEVVNLKVKDVNLKKGLIHIRDAKFGKERLLPIVDSLITYLKNYYNNVLLFSLDQDWFFPSPYRDSHYDTSTVYGHFRKLLWEVGISHSGKGPRLHDIRHTYAVHCLKRWVLDGNDLNTCLPYLAAYLGHEDMRGTQHYLRLTADMFPNLVSKVEDYCSCLIPEVNKNETN